MGPEAELRKYDNEDTWDTLFMKIREDSNSQHNYSLSDSRKSAFRARNRYRDVSPYDHSRIFLDRNGIDYINANLVQAPEANRKYIMTQGPLPNTCGHFWLMVWEQNSKGIVMLNHCVEKGRVKCHPYFPQGEEDDGENEMFFEDVGLKVNFIKQTVKSNYIVRHLLISDISSSQQKTVLQFHYTTWPDFGVPTSPGAFLKFLYHVRETGALDADVGPCVVHCSAGIGRSGTFCLVDTCLVLIKQNRDPHSISIQDILMDMRKFRMGLIQTSDQLRFSYVAVIEGSRKIIDELWGDKSEDGSDSTDTTTSNQKTAYSQLAESDSDLDHPKTRKRSLSSNRKKNTPPKKIAADRAEAEEMDNSTRCRKCFGIRKQLH